MNILLLDNYDSFTYNLLQYLRQLEGVQVTVFRNDAINASEVLRYDALVLSPGPGIPEEAGKMPAIIATAVGRMPILGVCLGHQALAMHFGAALHNLDAVQHGIATPIEILSDKNGLFAGLPDQILVGRYHSWVVDAASLPDCLLPTAVDEGGIIMAFQHKEYDITGLQFHPESILTPDGKHILQNFVRQIQPALLHREYQQIQIP